MRKPRRRAFTALEVMFALAILAFAILAMIAVLSSSAALDQHQREVSLALRELTRVMEQYRGMTPEAVATAISTKGGGGSSYEVTTVGTDEKGTTVLLDAKLTVTILTETEAAADLGMLVAPDLDGNDDEASSVIADYRVLPVRFELSWTSAGKDASTGANLVETRRMTTVFYPQTTSGS
jgi:type II secretory pathway pseudopilin PulG